MYSLIDPKKNNLSEEELEEIENMISKRRKANILHYL